jgi:membrane-bound ClpP family serine protease
MQFQVPQFLERESKIIGPLTFKQFILIAGGILLLVILYYLLPKSIFIIAVIVVLAGVFALVFGKIDGVPVGEFIINYFEYMFKSKQYVWHKEETSQIFIKIIQTKQKPEKEKMAPIRITPKSKLQEMSRKVEFGIKNIKE